MNNFLIFIIKILSTLPESILRLFSITFFYINKYFFKYRFNIIYNNLKIAFPKKNTEEIKILRDNFFKYFFNTIFEIIKSTNVNSRFIDKKVVIYNPEILNKYLKQEKSVILLSGHFNNWELLGAKISIFYDTQFVAIYKKLNNKIFDDFIKKYRRKFGGKIINMEDSYRYFIKNKNTQNIIGIIADQNPVINNNTKWLPFFNKPVPVFFGAENLAKKLNCPILFCNMQNKNSKYIISFQILTETPNEYESGEITKKYFKLLEKQINLQPERWLWSHRRWRHIK
tara:strand:+ start:15016 stop:15867 length:852 start_codon:yes stop_codon:yes gene_type:complete